MARTKSAQFVETIQRKSPNFPPSNIAVEVLHSNGTLGMIYIVGMHAHYQLPELLLVDVPTVAIHNFSYFCLGLCCQIIEEKGSSTCLVHHGCKMGRDLGCWVAMLEVSDPRERANIIKILNKLDSDSCIFLVKPLFDEWTVLPSAPDGNQTMQEQILETWEIKNRTTGFFLFCNGNKSDTCHTNILCVSALKMFQTPSCCDWDDGLTPLQVMYVQSNWNHFLYMGVGTLERIPMNRAQDYITNVSQFILNWQDYYSNNQKLASGSKSYTWDMETLETLDDDDIPQLMSCAVCGKSKTPFMCSKCHLIMYCSVHCQRLDWPTHKLTCSRGGSSK